MLHEAHALHEYGEHGILWSVNKISILVSPPFQVKGDGQ